MTEIATRYSGLDRVVYSADRIAERVEQLGREIDAHYPDDSDLLVIGLLKGAFVFTADLVRAIARPTLRVDFLVAALYGEGTDPSRDVRLHYDGQMTIADRDVVLVEDVIESGKTLNRICDRLLQQRPRSLEICALLHKHLTEDLRHDPRWVGFDAPPDWLVGYGLDLGERFRHLPFIAAVAPEGKRGF